MCVFYWGGIGVSSRCRRNVGLYYVLLNLSFFVVFLSNFFFFLSYLYFFKPFLIWPSFQIMRGGGHKRFVGKCVTEEEDKGVYIFLHFSYRPVYI